MLFITANHPVQDLKEKVPIPPYMAGQISQTPSFEISFATYSKAHLIYLSPDRLVW
jgi:hypothetical protein